MGNPSTLRSRLVIGPIMIFPEGKAASHWPAKTHLQANSLRDSGFGEHRPMLHGRTFFVKLQRDTGFASVLRGITHGRFCGINASC